MIPERTAERLARIFPEVHRSFCRFSVQNTIASTFAGRRNLTPDQMRLLRGRRYNRAKNQGARTDLTCGQNDHKSERTAERLANEHGVSPKTIRRDAKFAEEVERTPELLEAVSAVNVVRITTFNLSVPQIK